MQTLQQAITTKVLPATNTRPRRIIATSGGGFTATVNFKDSDTSDLEAHKQAVQAIITRLRWKDVAPEDFVAGVANHEIWVWVLKDKTKDIDMLRKSGAAVCVFTPEELEEGLEPIMQKQMESFLAESGNRLISTGV